MTKEELLAKIKAEIERLKATNPSEYNYQNAEGYVWALDDILYFLSTLESEKPKSLEKEIDAVWNPRFNLGWDENSLISMNRSGFEKLARHFAQYGAEHARDQMMKEAVEGEVSQANDGWKSLKLPSTFFGELSRKYEVGDKVRIIIVKEDSHE